MATIRHSFTAAGATRLINDADWDAGHVIQLTQGKTLVGDASGVATEVDLPAAVDLSNYVTTTSFNAGLATKQPTGNYSLVGHTHVIGDVTGLQAALDGKQPVGTYLTSITSGNVTTALGYTPTSVTGLTGVQTVAAFKTGLSLVKGDVGLGSVDNTADTAKNVLSATKLTTARTINGQSFDGTANITINAVDSTARLASSAVSAFGLTLIDDVDAATARATLGAQAAGSYLTSNQTITLSGDISGSGTTAITTSIGANKVADTMLAQVASGTFKGRSTAGTGNVETLTATQATALLDIFFSSAKGLVPASGGGTVNFLRADGTWAAPPGGGGSGTVTSVSVVSANGVSGSVATSTTTPAITLSLGAITPTSVSSSGSQLITGASGLVGYGAGSGSSVTQATSKTTGVTLNNPTGQITMNAAAMPAGSTASFTLTNSLILGRDIIVVNWAVGTAGAYTIVVDDVSTGSCRITVKNVSAGSLSEALRINFAIIRGSNV